MTFVLVMSSVIIPISTSAEGIPETRNPPIIKIGFLNDETGPISAFADAFEAAAEIAEDHINAMQSQYTFEIVMADSGCDGSIAQTAAQSLVNSGVVAVAGAACSGASIGANSVLSSYGIPQVSYASTSPELSNSSSYPGFMRVIPSDGQQGQANNYVLNQTGDSNPALVYADSLWWLGDSFIQSYGESNLCGEWSYYDWEITSDDDFSDEVYSIVGEGCDSVVMFTHSADGAYLVEELRDWNFAGSIIGGGDAENNDGIIDPNWPDEFYNPSEANGVHAVKRVYPGPQTNIKTAFEYECSQDSDCSNGIFTNEAYDSIRIIADAYINRTSYSSLEDSIMGTGTNWEGASGYVTFLPNGDARGDGFDICEWVSQNLSCTEVWMPGFSEDSDGDGWTDGDELACSTDPNDSNSAPYDSDSDGICNYMDIDDDNDGFSDVDEITNCGENNDPLNPVNTPTDTDGDQICNGLDEDDDNDGFSDVDEITNCGENNDPLNPVNTPTDTDGDQICNGLDEDDDNDGYDDGYDAFPLDSTEWDDSDGDGIGSNTDTDDDGDGWLDVDEVDCLTAPDSIFSIPDDSDGDWICDIVDTDDDNDGYLDHEDWAPFNPSEWIDTDDDGTGDNADDDDDNDGMRDEFDCAPLDINEWLDTDGDEICNNADDDDDGDLWSDSDEQSCETDSLDSESFPADTDGDLICDLVDIDDDDDGITDTSDAFPLDPTENLDTDKDGIGNNADFDDDGDGYSDIDENSNCGSESDPLDDSSTPLDFDLDLICDMLDEDVDNDGYLDTVDLFPYDSNEWYDNDMDGIGDNADLDDDNDGVLDDSDSFPLDPNEWQDRNNDGLGDNAYPLSIIEKLSLHPIMLMGTLLTLFAIIGAIIFRSLKKKENNLLYQENEISEQKIEPVFSKTTPVPPGIIIPSGSHKVSSWEELPPGGNYTETEPMRYIDGEGSIWIRQQDESWEMQ